MLCGKHDFRIREENKVEKEERHLLSLPLTLIVFSFLWSFVLLCFDSYDCLIFSLHFCILTLNYPYLAHIRHSVRLGELNLIKIINHILSYISGIIFLVVAIYIFPKSSFLDFYAL